MRGRLALAFAIAALPACAGPLAHARAAFTAPRLLSATPQLQFSEANAPAISADGDYVVFEGVVGSVSGVFRRDLATGEVEPVATSYVAGAKLGAPEAALAAPDAGAPSVSEEGRYVAFTTASNLGGQPSYQHCPQVYVRDMDRPANAPEAYVLASALNESSEAILYEGTQHATTCPPPAERPRSFPIAGAQAAPGVAISANGRYVVFTIDSPSDLRGAGEPPVTTPTPPGQVAVRDLREHRTTLITTTPAGFAVPAGGAFPSEYSLQYAFGDQLAASSAAISAEGNAVAWLGMDVGAQVPGASGGPEEVEPLWRAVAEGAPTAPPTRLLAGAGLDLGWELPPESPVRSGSLLTEGGDFVAPALSADGHTIAVQANVPTAAGEASASLRGGQVLPSDAYVVKVGESGQPQQVLDVTSTPNYLASTAALGSVEYLAISPDGTRVAFATNRTQFAPAAVVPISPSIPFNGFFETYVANIANGTLARVTSTLNESAPNGNAGVSSFSGDDRTLVFVSKATNLLWGDAIAAPEVYASEEAQSSERAPETAIGGEPALPPPPPEWTLDAVALPQSDGSVIVHALVPGAGRLDVSATAAVAQAKGRAGGRAAKRKGRVGKHGRIGERGRTAALASTSERFLAHARASTTELVLARASTSTDVPAQLQVRLQAAPSQRALVDGRVGLYAIVRVAFSAPGHPSLVRELPVLFHRQLAAATSKHARRSRPARPRRRRRG